MSLYVYSDPHVSKMEFLRNSYENDDLKKGFDSVCLRKVAEFLSNLGMTIDYEQDDIELVIIEWITTPENHTLFFEGVLRNINEKDNGRLKSFLLNDLERLSHEWHSLSQRRVANDLLSIVISQVNPILAIPSAERGYDRFFSDTWREIHESAEAYEEAERLEREEENSSTEGKD